MLRILCLLVNIPLHSNNSPSSILSVTHSRRTARIMSRKFISNRKRIKICGHGWLRFGEVNGRDARLPRHKSDFKLRTSQARDENGPRSLICLVFSMLPSPSVFIWKVLWSRLRRARVRSFKLWDENLKFGRIRALIELSAVFATLEK